MSVPDAPRSGPTRATRTRLDVTTVAAVVVPLLALAAAFLVDTGVDSRPGTPPVETPLSRASVICPAGGGKVYVTTTTDATGAVDVRAGSARREAQVASDAVDEVALGDRAVVVTGEGDLAPGLVAGRFSTPLASFDCRPPVFDQWFTGVGAGAKHRSYVQLVNPDQGRAVVDIQVLGRDGVVDAPQLRGLAVRGGESRTLDLAQVLPRRDELALHVTVLRGRLATSVRDTFRGLGRGRSGDDDLASQEAPAARNLLLGLPTGTGPRTLVVANPGATEGRAALRLVTSDSAFAPAGLDEIVLPPRSVVQVRIADVLQQAGTGDERPLGLLVESTVATTASLNMFVRGDLVGLVPVPPLAGPGTAVLPQGGGSLVLGGATGQGVVTVTLHALDGTEVSEQRVEVAPGRATAVAVPRTARLLTVTPQRTRITAVVLVTTDDGATVVRVREPVRTGLVPGVGPGLP